MKRPVYVDPQAAASNPAAAQYAQGRYTQPRGGGAPAQVPPHTLQQPLVGPADTPGVPPVQQAPRPGGFILPEQGRAPHAPQALPEVPNVPARKLSPHTLDGLAALQVQQPVPQPHVPAPTPAQKPEQQGAEPEESEREQVQRALERMDDYDLDALREALVKDLLNNEEQRTIIEARLEPLDLSELVVDGRISQLVPVVPGKFEPEFQSMTGEEELALKRLLFQERRSLDAPDRYLLDKYRLMCIACGLRAVNRSVFPTHLDTSNRFSDELFSQKFDRVLRLPFHMLASLAANYYWFDIRVRKLFTAENLKNG